LALDPKNRISLALQLDVHKKGLQRLGHIWLQLPVDKSHCRTFITDVSSQPGAYVERKLKLGFCSGQIKGNSDIAGTAIVLSIFINAAIPIILDIVLWAYIYFYLEAEDLDPSPRHSTWIKVVRNMLIMLGDTQLVTGLAIITASLINIYRDGGIPLYHIFIARALTELTLTGHTAAIIHVYPAKHNWTLRMGLFVMLNLLWAWWSLLALTRFDRWNWETPHCLENNSVVPGNYDDWIHISLAWIPIQSITLYMSLFKGAGS
jgi:hypothetical protein